MFVIDRTGSDGWRSLLDTVVRSPRPHVLLMIGDREFDAVDGVSLGRVPLDVLAEAVRPAELPVGDQESCSAGSGALRRPAGAVCGVFVGTIDVEPHSNRFQSHRPFAPPKRPPHTV